MKYLKLFEKLPGVPLFSDRGPEYDYSEVHEIDDDGKLTGYSMWLSSDESDDLEKRGLIRYDHDIDSGYGFHYYRVEDSDTIEEELELLRAANKYNL